MIFLCRLLAVWSSAICFAQTTYKLFPEGTFYFESRNRGPYELSGFKLDFYRIYKETDLYGRIEKLNEWTRSYMFKMGEEELSTHRAIFVSYGSLMDCMKEYEIRDERECLIGYIQGKYDTEALAEFLFFNAQHELCAYATVNHSDPHLSICSLDGQPFITGTRTLQFCSFYSNPTCSYYWIIKEEEGSLDPRFLWPFIGFIGEVWWES